MMPVYQIAILGLGLIWIAYHFSPEAGLHGSYLGLILSGLCLFLVEWPLILAASACLIPASIILIKRNACRLEQYRPARLPESILIGINMLVILLAWFLVVLPESREVMRLLPFNTVGISYTIHKLLASFKSHMLNTIFIMAALILLSFAMYTKASRSRAS